ncbi:hypothetical protein PCC9214_03148 [Planktothrix tepida]|uniref:SMODS and SLOG-associating 2TM effector domain-containing protein n=1 Tax=Planktothrix tepida PCC 9214 TaxID=671072 RepID=A0A1J1LR47_9CYAN|nr:hypothetical protein [Planktothrix tepida]CAD5960365.1 hypothetical protein PCC9214_03148 [Planktothrix tepida]CUR34702.1 membrane hypothetical protein [Planktothrix tepida PCC 9214]
MNWHKFFVLFAVTLAALMNSRAPYAALAGFPGEWRLVSALLISFPLVYFTEWAISYWVAISSIQRDIQNDQTQINLKHKKAQITGNQLIAIRAEAEQEVFNAVLKDYLHQTTKLFVALALTLLIIEYAATLFYVRFQGEDGDWITYVVPLLGIALTIITAFYKGKIVDYPQCKRQIAQKFDLYFQHRKSENLNTIKDASRKFWVLDGLTRYLLNYPQATPEQKDKKENQLWIEQLKHEYHKVLKEWQQTIHEKERELSQPAMGLINREAWENAIKQQIKAINEKFKLELLQIQDELQQRGYSIESNHGLSNGNVNQGLNPQFQLKSNPHS